MNLDNVKNLESWIISNNIPQPVKFTYSIVKVSSDGTRRYIKVFLKGMNITQMVANILEDRVSTARDTNGCIIIKGCGTDIIFETQHRLSRAFTQANSIVQVCPYNYVM